MAQVIKRGQELWLYGTYPVIALKDQEIPTELERSAIIPCTSITAYGDPDAEWEYAIDLPITQLTFSKDE
ncbi:MAG: hypothetical protein IK084_01625 [Bacteroidaceae bacterium]|nr:hypothetical protein [Bacteroidaceae bacterium]